MSQYDNHITTLMEAPDSQLDHQLQPKFEALLGQPLNEQTDGLLAILDECAYASLASDFAMASMHCFLMEMKQELGKGYDNSIN